MEMIAFFPLLFILFGVLFGLMRGTKKTLIRLMIIMSTTAVLFFITRPITMSVASSMTSGIAADLTERGIPLETVNNMIVGFTAPLVFLVLFIIVNMLSWIFFAIFTRNVERSGKLGGALIGAGAGLFIAIMFMMPLNGYAKFVHDNHVRLTQLVETIEEADIEFDFVDISALDQYMRPIRNFNRNPITRAINTVAQPMFGFLTDRVLDDISDSIEALNDAASTLVDLINALDDGFENITDKDTLTNIGALVDRLTNNPLFSDITLGDIAGIVGDGFDLSQTIPFEQIGADAEQTQSIVNALLDIRLSDFSFEQMFYSLFTVYDLIRDGVQPEEADMMDAMSDVMDALPLNKLPSAIQSLISSFWTISG